MSVNGTFWLSDALSHRDGLVWLKPVYYFFFTGSQTLPFYHIDVRGAMCNSIFAWTIKHLKTPTVTRTRNQEQ